MDTIADDIEKVESGEFVELEALAVDVVVRACTWVNEVVLAVAHIQLPVVDEYHDAIQDALAQDQSDDCLAEGAQGFQTLNARENSAILAQFFYHLYETDCSLLLLAVVSEVVVEVEPHASPLHRQRLEHEGHTQA